MRKKKFKENLEYLIELGKEQGQLTYDEVNDLLPDEIISSSQLDDIIMKLNDLDIDIVDEITPKKEIIVKPQKEEEEEYEYEEESFRDLINDPIRMYLKSIGKVPLLSRDDEIKLAQKIEEGEEKVKETLFPLSKKGIFILAVLSGVSEEMLFRGGIQPLLGLIPTSILFGVLHIGFGKEFYTFLPWTFFAIIMGLLLGYLFIINGDIIQIMLIHFLVNFVNLIRIGKYRDNSA